MQVILIHGLARSPLSLFLLKQRLEAAGHATETFGYAAFVESYDQIVQRLCDRLNRLADQGPYSIVAHSLGGVLTRSALDRIESVPAHVIMMGTPNQPPRMAAIAWNILPFRWISGQCGFNLRDFDFYDQLPKLHCPYTLIAGTAGPRGMLSPFGQDVNDSIVALDETRIADSDFILEFPVFHTFMMNDPQVQHTILQCLSSCAKP